MPSKWDQQGLKDGLEIRNGGGLGSTFIEALREIGPAWVLKVKMTWQKGHLFIPFNKRAHAYSFPAQPVIINTDITEKYIISIQLLMSSPES